MSEKGKDDDEGRQISASCWATNDVFIHSRGISSIKTRRYVSFDFCVSALMATKDQNRNSKGSQQGPAGLRGNIKAWTGRQ